MAAEKSKRTQKSQSTTARKSKKARITTSSANLYELLSVVVRDSIEADVVAHDTAHHCTE